MRFNDVSSKDLSSTHTTVVRSLGSGETILGPAIGSVVHVKERVFLLETKHGLVRCYSLHALFTAVTVIRLVGRTVIVPAFGNDENIVTSTERVGVDGSRTQKNVRVVTGSLI